MSQADAAVNESQAAPAASQDPARVDFQSVMSAAEPVRIAVLVTDQHLAHFEPTTYPEGVSIPYTVTSTGIRNMAVFLTCARCFCLRGVAMDRLQWYRPVYGCRGVVESHRDGTPHLHIFVEKSKTQLTWDQLAIEHAGVRYRPNVRALLTAEHQYNVHVYLDKEGEPRVTSRYQTPACPFRRGSRSTSSEPRCGFRELSGNGCAPIRGRRRGRISQVVNVARGLRALMEPVAPPPRFNPSEPDIVLCPWQGRVLRVPQRGARAQADHMGPRSAWLRQNNTQYMVSIPHSL